MWEVVVIAFCLLTMLWWLSSHPQMWLNQKLPRTEAEEGKLER